MPEDCSWSFSPASLCLSFRRHCSYSPSDSVRVGITPVILMLMSVSVSVSMSISTSIYRRELERGEDVEDVRTLLEVPTIPLHDAVGGNAFQPCSPALVPQTSLH